MNSFFIYLAAMVIFGTNGILAHYIDMSSADMVFMRTIIGGAFLLLVMLLKKKRIDRAALRREAPRLILSGVCMGANWILLFEAYKQTSVSIATLCYYCAPVIVLAASPLVLREKLSRRTVLGIVIVAGGMLLVTGLSGEVTAAGLACGLGSAVFYAGLVLTTKRIKGIDSLELTVVQVIVAAIALAPYALLTDGLRLPADAGGIAALIVLCVVNTGLACWMYFSSMRKLSARTVALCSYIDPVSSLLLSALILGERMSALQLIGAALVLGGAALGQKRAE